MRIVFVGAGELTVSTASRLLEGGHEVIIIEKLKSRIDELSEDLDCGFLHGDGSKPALLKETSPKDVDFLFCLTGNDQVNILASLVGRSLGFKRVVTKIIDLELEHICAELDLHDIIVPTRTISRYLSDMVSGLDILELSSIIKNKARVFSFVVQKGDSYAQEDLEIPDKTDIVWFYRKDEYMLPKEDQVFKEGDEVVLITHSDHLQELRKRFAPQTVNNSENQAEEQEEKEEKQNQQTENKKDKNKNNKKK